MHKITRRYVRRQTALRGVFATGLALVFILGDFHLFRPRPVLAVGSQALVISQVYGGAGCGTAGCSTYQNDFIEIFNRGKTVATCTGCSVQYAAAMGTSWQVTALPGTLTLQPGQYYLVAEAFGANGVSPIPTPDTTGAIAMSATAAKVALVNSTTALIGACPALGGTGTPAILDFVGYGGTANCFEGAGTAPAPSTTTADIRTGGGNIDTDSNVSDFQALAPTPRNTSSPFGTPTAGDGVISGRITTDTGAPLVGTVVYLEGTQSRRAITNAAGAYKFERVETNGFYTMSPTRANYSFSPASRSVSLIANNTEEAFTGITQGDNVNPLDTAEYFVRQQYVDILNRESDEAGFNYWSDQILACGDDAACDRQRRVSVASAFFIETEFKQSGAFIYNLYESALGRRPVYDEYSVDRSQVVGGPTLDAQKGQFTEAFVSRAEFMSRYENNLTADSFVDAIVANAQVAGIDLSSQRDSLISHYNTGASLTESRAFVLRDVSESTAVRDAHYNAAFVEIEYFGYLHRNADAQGRSFWLNVLNSGDPGNYRGMVCSFVTSAEYQHRFSSVASHSNSDCGR